jgi:hypothetical protein
MSPTIVADPHQRFDGLILGDCPRATLRIGGRHLTDADADSQRGLLCRHM